MENQDDAKIEQDVQELCQKAEGLGFDFAFHKLNQQEDFRKKVNDYIGSLSGGSLKELDISYLGNNLTQQQSKEVLDAIKKLTKLETQLHLNFQDNQVGDEIFNNFVSSYVSKDLKTKDLKFDFTNCQLADKLNFSQFGAALKQMELTKLQLKFGQNKITYPQVKEFFQQYDKSKLSKLTDFYLDLSDVNLTDEAKDQAISNALKCLDTIENLNLIFNNTQLDNGGFDKIAQSLKDHVRKIKNLEISIKDVKITDEGILAFSEIFKEMKTLSDIHFDFSNNKIGNAFSTLLGQMANFIRVNVVEFILDGTNVTGDGIAQNLDLLIKNKTLINEFSLSVERCDFKDDFFPKIRDNFSKLKQIMVLAFDFLGTNITKNGIIDIFKVIQNKESFPSIREFTLVPPVTYKFEADACSELAKFIENAPILRDLCVYFKIIDEADFKIILDACKKRHYIPPDPNQVDNQQEAPQVTNFLRTDHVNFILYETGLSLDFRKQIFNIYPTSHVLTEQEYVEYEKNFQEQQKK